ncbi:MAG: alpha/beta fold hydrolase, partial [Bacteriovorax sp.]
IGISMGGMIALRWAEKYPEEVEKVFVINASAGNLSGKAERFNLKEVKTLFNIFSTKNIYKKEELTLKLTTENFVVTKEVIEEFIAIQKSAPVKRTSGINQLWAASKFTIKKPLAVPVVILSGLKDRLVSPVCSEKLSKLLGAKLVVHPHAGHDLPLDDPDWLLSELRL